LNLSKDRAENNIAFLMGGRIAEEIVLNQKTTGAGNDIERATELARRMVCEWGMSDVMGPLTFGQKEGSIFLGRDIQQQRDYSEATAQAIDREIRDIVQRNYGRAREILEKNLQVLHDVAQALLEFETIDGAEIDTIMRGEKIVRKPTPSGGSSAAGSEPVTSGGGPSPAPVPA
jgi:cell division protease FtsH